ncbi:MAG: response regulator [Lacunisphaera sp.]
MNDEANSRPPNDREQTLPAPLGSATERDASYDTPVNILIVDDEPKNLTVLESLLDNPGYRLVRAKSADEALLALIDEEFALLILDIRMPVTTGIELAQVIRERKKTAQIPIIFLTAYYNDDIHVLEGYGSGAVDYLHKPVNSVILRSKVAVFAEIHRKSRECGMANRALITEMTQRRRAQEQLRALNETLEQRVTEQMKALRGSEERIRLATEATAVGIWEWNVLTGQLWWDAQMFRIYGRTPTPDGFVPYSDWKESVLPEDLPEQERVLRETVRRCGNSRREFRIHRQDDQECRHIQSAETIRNDTSGQAEWVVGTNLDITERKQAETALHRALDDLRSAQRAAERASKAKDGFLAALSHELRTPLTPVLMAAAALREDERLPIDAREQLGMMERNIALEARLIDDLLDLTKISFGKLKFRGEACDAHHLIDRSIEIVQDDARAKGISIERTFAAQHSWLMADAARFQQIIWNLLRNAVKFTPQSGRIAISTREEKSPDGAILLRIEVTDSGIGIDPAKLEQIFLPFDQGDLTGDHRFGGVGLGLAIARAVVELHGGRISAQSTGVNHGATFVVTLPGIIESPSSVSDIVSPVSAAAVASPLAPLHLLLVEDHESTRQTLSLLLQRDGHRVVTTGTVAEALDAAAVNQFDLVISDLGLPDGSGTELMGKLRDTYGLRGIALSGYGTDEDVARSRAAGFVTHLVKPVAIADLRHDINSIRPAGNSPIPAD